MGAPGVASGLVSRTRRVPFRGSVGLRLLLGEASTGLCLFFHGPFLSGAAFLLVPRPRLSAPGFLAPGYPPPGYPPSVPRSRSLALGSALPASRSWLLVLAYPPLAIRPRFRAPGYPLLAIRSWLLALAYPPLAIRLGYPSRLPAPGYPSRLSVSAIRPRFSLRVSSPLRWHQPHLDSTSCHAPGLTPPIRLPRGRFRGHCAGLLLGGSLGGSPRLPAPASIACAHLPGRAAPGGCLMRAWPAVWPYRPREAPVLGVVPGTPVRACRFAHADVAGSSHAGRLPLLPTGRAAPDRRCSRRSALRGPAAPAAPAVRERRACGTGGCRGGVVASQARGGLAGALLRRGCRRSRRRARPGHRGMSSWRAALAFVPGYGFPRRGSPGKRGDAARGETHPARRSRQRPFARWDRRVCRLGPTALSCARRSSWLPTAPRRTMPSPARTGGTGGGPRRHDTGGGGGTPSVPAHPGLPGRRSVRRATAHPGPGRAHRCAGGSAPVAGRAARCNAALHPAGEALRSRVGPVTVMRHYTRRGCPSGRGPGRRAP